MFYNEKLNINKCFGFVKTNGSDPEKNCKELNIEKKHKIKPLLFYATPFFN